MIEQWHTFHYDFCFFDYVLQHEVKTADNAAAYDESGDAWGGDVCQVLHMSPGWWPNRMSVIGSRLWSGRRSVYHEFGQTWEPKPQF